jgi:CheY-like chemotaxis protein
MNNTNDSRRTRILVVDDNPEQAESLKDLLEHAGHQVIAATQASTALEVARAFAPDVAVLDIELGPIDGYELVQHLRAIRELDSCLMIATTGYSQQDTPARSRQAGFQHHLVKPIEIGRLEQIIRHGRHSAT